MSVRHPLNRHSKLDWKDGFPSRLVEECLAHDSVRVSFSWKATATSQSYRSRYWSSRLGDVFGRVSHHEAPALETDPAQEPCLHHRKSPLFPNPLVCLRILSGSPTGLWSKLRVFVVVIRFLFEIVAVLSDLCSFPLEKENVVTRSESSRVLHVLCSFRRGSRARNVFLARDGRGHKPPSDAVAPVIRNRTHDQT